jgi:hypothetical protein
MKTSREKTNKNELKLETFKVVEMLHPEKIEGGGDGGWTIRKDHNS